ncbi:unnamed protein product [Haemonchus placei]|uniref:Reverse transcriptase domain-containing protein n=1 Tax=Haemonchus placei TaxID=6290 RepID=A0A0N4X5Y3_HAEPC|nr:unnamed protein product [Haemonchus placei]
MKLYERLVDSRLMEFIQILRVQFGSMPERSITDAVFIARQVIKKYREESTPCYPASFDLEEAFVRLPRHVIWRALRKGNVPEHLIFLIKDMYDGSTTAVRTQVHQGSALSPFLYLLFMDVIISGLYGPQKTSTLMTSL